MSGFSGWGGRKDGGFGMGREERTVAMGNVWWGEMEGKDDAPKGEM